MKKSVAVVFACALLASGQPAGVEIDSIVADGPWSVIRDQVANGVAVRMAVLYLLAGGDEHGS